MSICSMIWLTFFLAFSHPCWIVIVMNFVSLFCLLSCVLAHSGNYFLVCWCHSGHYNKAITSNVNFKHLHFELLFFVCVYTSFTLVFYQSYAAIFAESKFIIMVQFYGVAVSPGSLSEASSFFGRSHICSVGVLHLWYIGFC